MIIILYYNNSRDMNNYKIKYEIELPNDSLAKEMNVGDSIMGKDDEGDDMAYTVKLKQYSPDKDNIYLYVCGATKWEINMKRELTSKEQEENLKLVQIHFRILNKELLDFVFNLENYNINVLTQDVIETRLHLLLSTNELLSRFNCDDEDIKNQIGYSLKNIDTYCSILYSRGFKKLDDIKFIISIKESFAKDWAMQKYFDLNKINIITRVEQARGIDFTNVNTIIMKGEDFDYPESSPTLTIKEKDEFYKLLDLVNRRIKLNTYEVVQ